ncbi:MAG: aspartate--tRNA(Asn) ligase [Bacteroidota bacterium]|nr:aspartate--tRNA(Asn) ligase [Bacteroidota bacterium]MDP4231757.1 aspartate--tRNA(Asn) ligase [Bacteroidota bacterium]MDP4243493.1 aspartate--tRNA(Asn) ligase [Bacteroidota bacterium]MDP4287094.1 aspartate--tRNA(Asn) ligase [Bacteroidota bacterium]
MHNKNRAYVNAAMQMVGNTVCLCGFAEQVRVLKKVAFLILRDSTGSIQCVTTDPILMHLVASCPVESAVRVRGTVSINENVKLSPFELLLEEIEIINPAEALPFQPDAHEDVRVMWRFLDLRTSARNLMIFRIQTAIEDAMREYLSEDFVELHTPKLMGVPSEGRAELFETDYFGKRAYLAQSPQLYKQLAIASGFEKVFEIGPVFRADPSATSRHTAEFTGVDIEMSWIDSHEDIMDFEERWLAHVIARVKEDYGDTILKEFHVTLQVPVIPFPRISIAECYDILEQKGHPVHRNGDLSSEFEKLIGEHVAQTHNHEFVFITDYPISVRPFYHMRTGNLTNSFDLLWKGMEITTGAQREHRYDILLEQVAEKGINKEHIQFYLDCFRYGCPPHGGLGLGLSRLLMNMLNLDNVREATFISRTKTRLVP